MCTTNILLRGPAQKLELAVAWSILLKDYVGSPELSFLLSDRTDDGRSLQTKTIDVFLREKGTLDQLYDQIQPQLSTEALPRRSSPITPFQTQISILSQHGRSLEGPAAEGEAAVKLHVKCMLLKDGREINISISPSHIATATITNCSMDRMILQFEQVLRQIQLPNITHTPIYNMNTASNRDLRDIWTWNGNVPLASKATANEIFLEHVRQRPSGVALDAWDGKLTYRDLDALSTKLSAYLSCTGVCQGAIVPICHEKSLWVPVMILAVLKAGAAFFLLDEALPQERLKQLSLILDSQISVALSS
ncbi:hypothetical protein FQN49_001366, partial [Arthroderma sp. PD_2]